MILFQDVFFWIPGHGKWGHFPDKMNGNPRVTPPMPNLPRDKAILRDNQPQSSPNNASLRSHFPRGVGIGGTVPLDSHHLELVVYFASMRIATGTRVFLVICFSIQFRIIQDTRCSRIPTSEPPDEMEKYLTS